MILIIQIASGCTSLRPLPDEKNALEQAIKPGDKVHIVTRDGQEMEFKVTQVTNERIEETDQGVNVDNIAKIDRREFSGWKTGGVAGALIIGAVAFVIYALSQVVFVSL
jgi:hypothetical protein